MTDPELIDDIERREGWPVYTDLPDDLGGPTKGGITLATLRAWRRNPVTTVASLITLERPEARAIYQFLFLQPFATLRPIDEAVYAFCVDLGVLRGPRRVALMLQEIVGATQDGWIGPHTLTALAPFKAHLLVMLIGYRFAHIEQRVREQPSQRKFRAGWRSRNASFLP